MTIQEAIKSGKPFRRPIWVKDVWLVIIHFIPYYIDGLKEGYYTEQTDFNVSDILADDWEVKP